ncbi:MAG: class I SAM-dependent methyltransferase [Thermoleophilaceae bacterium]
MLEDRIAANPLWYHAIEVAPGVVTPGWFDLRPVVDRLPWPDVAGKRCLDVGTYDGFLAFELERRGASEVVATDIGGHEQWDWPEELRARGPTYLAELAGPKGAGFEIAHEALGSRVEKVTASVYDLAPERVGTFDVVVCGSLLLHLRDPVGALGAIHSVCTGYLLSAEQIDLALTTLMPRLPLARVGPGERLHWWVPNAAGHERMVEAAGFRVKRRSGVYCVPFGPGHPAVARTPRNAVRAAAQRGLCGGTTGVPHRALLGTATD